MIYYKLLNFKVFSPENGFAIIDICQLKGVGTNLTMYRILLHNMYSVMHSYSFVICYTLVQLYVLYTHWFLVIC